MTNFVRACRLSNCRLPFSSSSSMETVKGGSPRALSWANRLRASMNFGEEKMSPSMVVFNSSPSRRTVKTRLYPPCSRLKSVLICAIGSPRTLATRLPTVSRATGEPKSAAVKEGSAARTWITSRFFSSLSNFCRILSSRMARWIRVASRLPVIAFPLPEPTRIRLTPFSRMNFFISSSVLM